MGKGFLMFSILKHLTRAKEFRDTWLTKGAGNHMRLATLALSCPRFKK